MHKVFYSTLKKFIGDREFGIENRTALVLGAGGSSRAVIYALENDGWDVTVAARRIEQAQELACDLRASKLWNSTPKLSNLYFLN